MCKGEDILAVGEGFLIFEAMAYFCCEVTQAERQRADSGIGSPATKGVRDQGVVGCGVKLQTPVDG